MQINSQPQIRLIFKLTKNDSTDFDRDAVTQRLCIVPSKTNAPALSKGRLTCDADIKEVEKNLSGVSILPATSPPYQMLKHAYWCVELSKKDCRDLDEPLRELQQILLGKETEVQLVCKDYNLNATLIVRVFAESSNMPELMIPSNRVSFWASIGVSIGFDFYLD